MRTEREAASGAVQSDSERIEPNKFVRDVAEGLHKPTAAEVQELLRHIAAAGFDPTAREAARGRLRGLVVGGQVVNARTLLRPEVRHWLLHARMNREWPDGTTQADYVVSLRAIVLDPDSGVLVNHYKGELSVAIVRESRELRGPGGFVWVLIQYRVATGHWVTALQPADGLAEFNGPEWGRIRWLRRPTIQSGSL